MDIYTVEYCSAMKMNELMPFAATLMDLEIIIPNEVGQRKANIWCHLYVESEKVIELIYKTNRLTDLENKLLVTEGERWEKGIN